MVHRWANGGRGRAVLSFGYGEEGTQWGPVKSGSAEFIIFFFFSSSPFRYHSHKGNTERGRRLFCIKFFSHDYGAA